MSADSKSVERDQSGAVESGRVPHEEKEANEGKDEELGRREGDRDGGHG